MPRQVDYYFSFQSPWAYVGHKAFRDLVSAYDLKVNHKPVVLVDLFSETGGLPLTKRHRVRFAGLRSRWRSVLGTGPDRFAGDALKSGRAPYSSQVWCVQIRP